MRVVAQHRRCNRNKRVKYMICIMDIEFETRSSMGIFDRVESVFINLSYFEVSIKFIIINNSGIIPG